MLAETVAQADGQTLPIFIYRLLTNTPYVTKLILSLQWDRKFSYLFTKGDYISAAVLHERIFVEMSCLVYLYDSWYAVS